MGAIPAGNRIYEDISDFETCVVCKKQKADILKILVNTSKNVSVCTLKCFITFKQLQYSVHLLLDKKEVRKKE